MEIGSHACKGWQHWNTLYSGCHTGSTASGMAVTLSAVQVRGKGPLIGKLHSCVFVVPTIPLKFTRKELCLRRVTWL